MRGHQRDRVIEPPAHQVSGGDPKDPTHRGFTGDTEAHDLAGEEVQPAGFAQHRDGEVVALGGDGLGGEGGGGGEESGQGEDRRTAYAVLRWGST